MLMCTTYTTGPDSFHQAELIEGVARCPLCGSRLTIMFRKVRAQCVSCGLDGHLVEGPNSFVSVEIESREVELDVAIETERRAAQMSPGWLAS